MNQDGFCEFISLLTVICIDGTTLMLALVYKKNTHNLQDIWLEDFDHSNKKTHFVVSKKNWTNKELKFS